jgi:hypothetical protein
MAPILACVLTFKFFVLAFGVEPRRTESQARQPKAGWVWTRRREEFNGNRVGFATVVVVVVVVEDWAGIEPLVAAVELDMLDRHASYMRAELKAQMRHNDNAYSRMEERREGNARCE